MQYIISIIFVLFFSFNLFGQNTGTTTATAIPVQAAKTAATSSATITNKLFMHTGFSFDGALKTQIVSYNVASPVIVNVEYDIIYLKKVVIPKGSLIIGIASTYHSEDRVSVSFHTIVFPDGSELKFNGIALQTDGSAGLVGEVKKATYKATVNTILNTAGNLIPGIGGDIAKGIAGSGQQQIDNTVPDTIITVKKDTALLIYNVNRVEYDTYNIAK